ncbi:hypothetical protein LTR09_001095 [Extremus antarcticus]|uniref:F-box domain-containing protein n=1 Tax=Extremus antarcticus TaxID=702011 RepID=A0AAJ0GI44_9PEZI|nr:hypothetical protein LTR09_001095 [Extremus antarcticus]
MAAAVVFNMPELLEPILLHLSPKNLFVVKRVNSTWHTLITDSDELKRKTFMAAEGAVITLNKQVEDLFVNDYGPTYNRSEVSVTMAPIFNSKHEYPHHSTPSSLNADPETHHVMVWANTLAIDSAAPSAIRNMFVTQPHIDVIELSIQRDAPEPALSYAQLRGSNGITVGLVIDTYKQMIEALAVEQKPVDGEKMLLKSRFIFERYEEDSESEDDEDDEDDFEDDYPLHNWWEYDRDHLKELRYKMMMKRSGPRFREERYFYGYDI